VVDVGFNEVQNRIHAIVGQFPRPLDYSLQIAHHVLIGVLIKDESQFVDDLQAKHQSLPSALLVPLRLFAAEQLLHHF